MPDSNERKRETKFVMIMINNIIFIVLMDKYIVERGLHKMIGIIFYFLFTFFLFCV